MSKQVQDFLIFILVMTIAAIASVGAFPFK